MDICGIVAEFNPFHYGHKYLISSAKAKIGNDCAVVAVMSGNFVQRGEPAFFDKFTRTRAALENGVDVVIELPVHYSVATAEKFSFGSIKMLESCGVVSHIAFGSECGDIDLLKRAVSAMNNDEVKAALKDNLKKGVTFAAARQNAVKSVYENKPEIAEIFKNSNDILATEYLDAMNRLSADFTPICIKRNCVMHDDDKTSGQFTSASNLRHMIENGEDFSSYLPNSEIYFDKLRSGGAPASLNNAARAVMMKLRSMSIDDFAKLPDISEGLQNRIYNACQTACEFDKLYDMIKTKRYTHARIRRIILSALLGLSNESFEPQYIRVLGFTEKGQNVLKIMKQKSSLPIVTSYSSAKTISKSAAAQFETAAKNTDFYNLLTPEIRPCGDEFRQAVVKI